MPLTTDDLTFLLITKLAPLCIGASVAFGAWYYRFQRRKSREQWDAYFRRVYATLPRSYTHSKE